MIHYQTEREKKRFWIGEKEFLPEYELSLIHIYKFQEANPDIVVESVPVNEDDYDSKIATQGGNGELDVYKRQGLTIQLPKTG